MDPRTTRRRLILLAGALVAVPLLSSCASAPTASAPPLSVDVSKVESYSSTMALLDPVAGTIALPLDAYAMNDDDLILVETANDHLMDDCLKKSGFRNPLLDVDRRQGVRIADRRYGVWTDAEARYGYDLPPNPTADKLSELLQKQSQAWSDAQGKCYTKSAPLPILTLTVADANKTVVALGARGATEAFVYASGTKEWKKARQDWWDCMSGQGLTPRTGPEDWGPVIPADAEAALRTASIDVACKRKVDLVQRLANIEARYQAAFVAENQAALNTERGRVDQVLNKAKEIVGTR